MRRIPLRDPQQTTHSAYRADSIHWKWGKRDTLVKQANG